MNMSTSFPSSGSPVPRPDIRSAPSDTRDEIFGLVPPLRAYALLLVGDPVRADDLVEMTLRAAWAEVPQTGPLPCLKARLFTRLRHASHASLSQSSHIRGKATAPLPRATFRDRLAALPIHQRDALLLVVGEGFSVQDASTICGCSAVTVARRAARGRRKLAKSAVPELDLIAS